MYSLVKEDSLGWRDYVGVGLSCLMLITYHCYLLWDFSRMKCRTSMLSTTSYHRVWWSRQVYDDVREKIATIQNFRSTMMILSFYAKVCLVGAAASAELGIRQTRSGGEIIVALRGMLPAALFMIGILNLILCALALYHLHFHCMLEPQTVVGGPSVFGASLAPGDPNMPSMPRPGPASRRGTQLIMNRSGSPTTLTKRVPSNISQERSPEAPSTDDTNNTSTTAVVWPGLTDRQMRRSKLHIGALVSQFAFHFRITQRLLIIATVFMLWPVEPLWMAFCTFLEIIVFYYNDFPFPEEFNRRVFDISRGRSTGFHVAQDRVKGLTKPSRGAAGLGARVRRQSRAFANASGLGYSMEGSQHIPVGFGYGQNVPMQQLSGFNAFGGAPADRSSPKLPRGATGFSEGGGVGRHSPLPGTQAEPVNGGALQPRRDSADSDGSLIPLSPAEAARTGGVGSASPPNDGLVGVGAVSGRQRGSAIRFQEVSGASGSTSGIAVGQSTMVFSNSTEEPGSPQQPLEQHPSNRSLLAGVSREGSEAAASGSASAEYPAGGLGGNSSGSPLHQQLDQDSPPQRSSTDSPPPSLGSRNPSSQGITPPAAAQILALPPSTTATTGAQPLPPLAPTRFPSFGSGNAGPSSVTSNSTGSGSTASGGRLSLDSGASGSSASNRVGMVPNPLLAQGAPVGQTSITQTALDSPTQEGASAPLPSFPSRTSSAVGFIETGQGPHPGHVTATQRQLPPNSSGSDFPDYEYYQPDDSDDDSMEDSDEFLAMQ